MKFAFICKKCFVAPQIFSDTHISSHWNAYNLRQMQI